MSNLEAHHIPAESVSNPLGNLVSSLCLIRGPSGLSLVHSSILSLKNIGCKFSRTSAKMYLVFS